MQVCTVSLHALLSHVKRPSVSFLLSLRFTLVCSLAEGSRWFQKGAPLASVLRQDANPSPGANSASRLRFDVDGPSSSEQESPVSLEERSLFFTGQELDDPDTRPFASTGVFSRELSPLEEEVFVSAGGGEDSKVIPHSTASAGVENGTGAQLLSVAHNMPLTSTELWPSSLGSSLEPAGTFPAVEASVLGVRVGGLPSQWPQVEGGPCGSTIGGDFGDSGVKASGTGLLWLCWAGRRPGIGGCEGERGGDLGISESLWSRSELEKSGSTPEPHNTSPSDSSSSSSSSCWKRRLWATGTGVPSRPRFIPTRTGRRVS